MTMFIEFYRVNRAKVNTYYYVRDIRIPESRRNMRMKKENEKGENSTTMVE